MEILDNRYGKQELCELFDLIYTGNIGHFVKVQYSTTFYYYANLLMTIFFILTHPILELSLYNQFNHWNIWTIIWSSSLMALDFYSVMLIVGSEVV